MRKSISTSGQVKFAGPIQRFMCSGLDQSAKTSEAGASKVRVMRSSSWPVWYSLALLLGFKLREIGVHLVETFGPEAAIARQPVVDGLERSRLQPTGPPLRLAPARDEARSLHHLQMPRYRRQADVEWLGDLVYGRFPLGEPRKDGPPGRVRECRKGDGKGIRHYLTSYAINILAKYCCDGSLSSHPESMTSGGVTSLPAIGTRISPPGVEVVRRAVAGADLDPVRGGERLRHIGLGGADRLGQTKPLGEAGGDGGRQRAAGAMGILRRDAVGGETHECTRLDQEIDALGAAAMTAFEEHRPRPQRQQPLALLAHLGLVAGDRRIEQRRRLRQVRRDDERAWEERALERLDCVGGKQLVARGCDHDRIEHDFVLPPALEPGRDR